MKRLFVDVECYVNYFLVKILGPNGKFKNFEMFEDDTQLLNRDTLGALLTSNEVEVITFNGNGYDLPMIAYAISGANCEQLKEASDEIITTNIKPWNFYRKYKVDQLDANHIDLIEIAPGMLSLKIYGGRLHNRKLQDLPVEPSARLTLDEMVVTEEYCGNDLLVTKELFEELEPAIDLRRAMSEQYGIDLRSKSDAQIAEAVLRTEFQRITGFPPQKVNVDKAPFRYEPPPYIKFLTSDMQDVLETIVNAEMVIEKTGHVKMPKEIETLKILIGHSTYKIGIGGLHSQESEVSHYANDETLLIDRDVTSYYPNLMLNMGMCPDAFGTHFTDIFQTILDERVIAKRSGDKVKNEALKIVLNGTFGKTSNKYSMLYNPRMMIAVTITGQLSLLMLIEMLELMGIPVVSANTDGVVIKCPVEKKDTLDAIIGKWEKRTNLNTEETQYRALHSRDVNNYIAITTDGKVKTKGVYGDSGIRKNPQFEICAEAVVKALSEGAKIKETVFGCKDIRKFISLRTVKGGAEKEGYVLGKAVRWYMATGIDGGIRYKTNGNLVPRSEGGKPLMELPEELPDDINYAWYMNECKEILMSLGVMPRPQLEKVPRKNSKAWKSLVEDGVLIEGDKGKWVWAYPKAHMI